MKSTRIFGSVAMGIGLSMNAAAQDLMPQDMHIAVGVRMWRTDWTTWNNVANRDYGSADLRWSAIPVVSLTYRDWLVSTSYQVPGTFDFNQFGYSFRRKEFDANVGYFVVPGRLAVTLGYKDVRYTSEKTPYSWQAKGPTVGLTGNAPLADWAALYGNMAYGRPKLDDVTHFVGQKGSYLLTEFGLAFPLGAHSDALSGAVVTAGYRYQRISAYPSVSSVPHNELYEVTQGPVIGIAYRF
jgi:hypothetical protein